MFALTQNTSHQRCPLDSLPLTSSVGVRVPPERLHVLVVAELGGAGRRAQVVGVLHGRLGEATARVRLVAEPGGLHTERSRSSQGQRVMSALETGGEADDDVIAQVVILCKGIERATFDRSNFK